MIALKACCMCVFLAKMRQQHLIYDRRVKTIYYILVVFGVKYFTERLTYGRLCFV